MALAQSLLLLAALLPSATAVSIWDAPLRLLPSSSLRVTRGPLTGSTFPLSAIAPYLNTLVEATRPALASLPPAPRYDIDAIRAGDALLTLVLDGAGLAELAAAAALPGLENQVRTGMRSDSARMLDLRAHTVHPPDARVHVRAHL